ncbi:MAG: orotidine-5'-phosphate decarboxylase [Deltaproteobacteria bacterium]|nr:orotidine-5'-phosphate decarboxylase [Deltaproteobacteria bacterium]
MKKNPIFVALDRPDLDAALQLAQELAPHVGGFKVGLELLNTAGAPHVVAALRDYGLPIFFDGKFHDIPNTVAGAVRAVARLGVTWCNVHAAGGSAMMRAAVAAAHEGAEAAGVVPPAVLAVTVLTSLTVTDLQQLGVWQIPNDAALQTAVVTLAERAQAAGCAGVVASPQEIATIRAACGREFLIVTPGVRPTWTGSQDQARIMTPHDALAAGADYLVIGRPITNPSPDVGTPAAAAQRILQEIDGTPPLPVGERGGRGGGL